MADEVCLKNDDRIAALMMVMTLCLMVYNIAQFKLRQFLKENGETLPNQLNKQVQNVTLRWIFQLMRGISLATVLLSNGHENKSVCNIEQVQRKVMARLQKPLICLEISCQIISIRLEDQK